MSQEEEDAVLDSYESLGYHLRQVLGRPLTLTLTRSRTSTLTLTLPQP